MRGFFSSENGLFRFLARAMDVVMLSILWAVLCVPLVTMGPATAALYDTTVRYVRDYDAGTYSHFFRVFKRNLRDGIPVGLIFLALVWVIVKTDGYLFAIAEQGGMGYVLYAAFTVCLLVLMGMASYLFPVLSRFENGLGRLFANSVMLAMAHLPSTLCLGALLWASIWAVMNFWFPIVFLPCILMLLDSLFLERIFRPFMPEKEQAEL